MKKTIILFVLATFLLSSCFVNRTTVGYGPEGASIHNHTFSKAKHHYIFFGLISLNEPKLPLPPNGVGYEVKTSFGFWDAIFTGLTMGIIYGQRTERILIYKQEERAIEDHNGGGHK